MRRTYKEQTFIHILTYLEEFVSLSTKKTKDNMTKYH